MTFFARYVWSHRVARDYAKLKSQVLCGNLYGGVFGEIAGHHTRRGGDAQTVAVLAGRSGSAFRKSPIQKKKA
jgi:hypothetical protein